MDWRNDGALTGGHSSLLPSTRGDAIEVRIPLITALRRTHRAKEPRVGGTLGGDHRKDTPMIDRDRLTLHEEILLLALRDEEGTIASGTNYSYALGGAILAELILPRAYRRRGLGPEEARRR